MSSRHINVSTASFLRHAPSGYEHAFISEPPLPPRLYINKNEDSQQLPTDTQDSADGKIFHITVYSTAHQVIMCELLCRRMSIVRPFVSVTITNIVNIIYVTLLATVTILKPSGHSTQIIKPNS